MRYSSLHTSILGSSSLIWILDAENEAFFPQVKLGCLGCTSREASLRLELDVITGDRHANSNAGYFFLLVFTQSLIKYLHFIIYFLNITFNIIQFYIVTGLCLASG